MQPERTWVALARLLVPLECEGVVCLGVVAARHVVARFRADGSRVAVLVRPLGEGEGLLVLGAVEVVVGEVVEYGGVVRLELVRALQHGEGVFHLLLCGEWDAGFGED